MPPVDDQNLIRRYLLGLLAEEQSRHVEERLLTDDEFHEELSLSEDELIDDYLSGDLTPAERESFAAHFLSAPERQRKLSFARALRKYVSAPAEPAAAPAQGRKLLAWPRLLTTQRLKLAAAALILLSLSLGVWRVFFYQSDLDKGLVALRASFPEQRPTQARLSGFDYAPLLNIRGAQPSANSIARDRAEALLRNAAHDNPGPAAHHALGLLYLSKRQFDEAVGLLAQALEADANNALYHSDLGAALLERGRAARQNEPGQSQQDLGRSLEHLNRAIELDNSLLEARFNRALVYQQMSMPQQAAEEWRRYLELDPQSRWAEEARQHLRAAEEELGRAARIRERLFPDFVNALAVGNDEQAWRALSLSRDRAGNIIVERLLDEYLDLIARDRSEEAGARLSMLARAGQIERARADDRFTEDVARFYQTAAPARRALAAQARQLMRTAREFYDRSEWDLALPLYDQAQQLFAQAGHESEALFAEGWAGYCHLRVPDAARSLAVFGRLARLHEERGYKSLRAQSLHALSDAYTSQDEMSQALRYAERAQVLAEQIDDGATVLRCLQQFVAMRLRLGDHLGSLDWGVRALELASRLPAEPKVVWPFYHDMAANFNARNFTGAALALEREALRLAAAADFPLIKARTYTQLGLIHERRRDFGEAIRNGQLALAEGERVSGERIRLNITANASMRLGHLHRMIGELDKAIELYDRSIQLYARLPLTIYLYEARKGKLLAYIGGGDIASTQRELEATLNLFEQYRDRIEEDQHRSSFFELEQSIYDIAINFAYTTLGDPARAFEYAESSRARSLLATMRAESQPDAGAGGSNLRRAANSPPARLAEIRARLPEQVRLIEYAVLEDRLLIWIVSRERFASVEQRIGADEIGQKVNNFLRLIQAPVEDAESLRRAAQELFNILIGQVEPALDGNRQLFIVPDRSLSFLPFGALVSPATGRWLAEDYTVTLAPSANVLLACSDAARRRGEAAQDETLLSVGNPSFDRSAHPALPDLPAASREATEIANLYRSVLLLGERASERRVRQELPAAHVVHIAAHHVVNERSNLLSGLLLAGERAGAAAAPEAEADGILRARDIYGLRLSRARLVVLSACQTGIERAYRGEGSVGLARAFISAGVPLVVSSLWPVDSDLTAELMIRFHRLRREAPVSTAEALRRAQSEMMRAPEERYRRPQAWAAFVTVGGYAEF